MRDFAELRKRYLSSRPKRSQFRYFHKFMVDCAGLPSRFPVSWSGLEVGCGITPMKDNFSNVIASDVMETPCCDFVIDGTSLGQVGSSFDAIFAVNSFHHISDKREFLLQCSLLLSPGGKLIILEPSDTFLSSIVYPRLFASETYCKAAPLASLKTSDPEYGANQAASYICFIRERDAFLDGLGYKVVSHKYCRNWLSFLLSGGTNFPVLAPHSLIKFLENRGPLVQVFALHWVITLEKL